MLFSSGWLLKVKRSQRASLPCWLGPSVLTPRALALYRRRDFFHLKTLRILICLNWEIGGTPLQLRCEKTGLIWERKCFLREDLICWESGSALQNPPLHAAALRVVHGVLDPEHRSAPPGKENGPRAAPRGAVRAAAALSIPRCPACFLTALQANHALLSPSPSPPPFPSRCSSIPPPRRPPAKRCSGSCN